MKTEKVTWQGNAKNNLGVAWKQSVNGHFRFELRHLRNENLEASQFAETAETAEISEK